MAPPGAALAFEPDKPSDDDATTLIPPSSKDWAEDAEAVLNGSTSGGVIVELDFKFEAAFEVAASIEDAASTTPLQWYFHEMIVS